MWYTIYASGHPVSPSTQDLVEAMNWLRDSQEFYGDRAYMLSSKDWLAI